MKLVRQPPNSNLCGQACIATICNISLEEAITLIGTKGATNTKHLKCALDTKGIKHGNRRVLGLPKEGTALLFWRQGVDAHWTVWYNNKHYDPVSGVLRKTPRHLSESRVTSHLPIIMD